MEEKSITAPYRFPLNTYEQDLQWKFRPERKDQYSQPLHHHRRRAEYHHRRHHGKVPLLTAEEEIDLAKRMELGDQEAKKRLAEANLRSAISSGEGSRPSSCKSCLDTRISLLIVSTIKGV